MGLSWKAAAQEPLERVRPFKAGRGFRIVPRESNTPQFRDNLDP